MGLDTAVSDAEELAEEIELDLGSRQGVTIFREKGLRTSKRLRGSMIRSFFGRYVLWSRFFIGGLQSQRSGESQDEDEDKG